MRLQHRYKFMLLYSVLIAYNLVAWEELFRLSHVDAALFPLGVLAFVLGLKHAADADHIAAIDNTTRKLMNDGQKPIGVGLYFSMGHSTVVFILAMGLAIASGVMQHDIHAVEHLSGIIGTGISAAFLYFIAVLNLVVLKGIYDVFRQMRRQTFDYRQVEEILAKQGFMNRYFGRLFATIRKSSQMYYVGFLFGLGFDTASEMIVISMAAVAATHHMPLEYIVILPVLFAGGMTLVDTTDGVLMLSAYQWAFQNPIRKVYYNMVITTISVGIALIVGTIELLQVVSSEMLWKGSFWYTIQTLSFGKIGFVIIGVLLISWFLAIMMYYLKGYDQTPDAS